MSWTAKHDQNFSYSNHCCHGNDFWRVLARQCHVVGLILKLQSLINGNGHYAVSTHHHIKANKLCVRENPSYYHELKNQ